MAQIVKIIFFFIFVTFLVSCNTTKYVKDNEYLLHENTIYIDETKSSDADLYSYIIQRPNPKTAGIPIPLIFYNFGDPEFEKSFDEWIINHPERYNSLKNVFSSKQTNVIYNTEVGFNNWFLNKGQAPEIVDLNKAKKTVNSLRSYYFSKGFFDVEVSLSDTIIKEKQKDIAYHIKPNDRYYIDTIKSQISSAVLDSIYRNNLDDSFLKSGEPFVFNKFELEDQRLLKLYRNSGIYHFKSNNIGFWTDSTKMDYRKEITLRIPNRTITKKDSTYSVPYRIQKIKNVNVYTNFDLANIGAVQKDSASYNGINFFAKEKLEYKPKHLSQSIFIHPDSIYRDEDLSLTLNHLRKLQNFKSGISVKYKENEDETLDANIYLNPLKKYALTFNVDATTSNIKPFGILGKFSFLDRNVFKGSELFEISFQGSFLNVTKDASNSSSFFNAWEFLSNASLTFPRILFPFNTSSIIPKRMSPQTNINISYGTQKNIGLDRNALTAGFGYNWRTSKKAGHKLDLYNVQYIKNQNVDNYFIIYDSEYNKLNDASEDIFGVPLPQDNTVLNAFMDVVLDPNKNYDETHPDSYDEVSDVNERRDILIEDVLVPVISYSFNYNTKENINDQDFYFFTGRIVAAGNLTTALSFDTNSNGQKLMLGVPIAQYLKTEVEFKRYWDFKKDNILVFRTFVGAAFPYGNSNNIPFSRSYSAGGSNDIRAWRTYDLGPGGVENNLEFNVGSFKIVTNFEYRFKLMNNIYSALFIDLGNIWDITDSDLVSDQGKFTSLSSLKNIAIGSGFGIRYDFNFLVFRFDTGFKTYEPYLTESDKWLRHYNFSNAVYNIGINYPF